MVRNLFFIVPLFTLVLTVFPPRVQASDSTDFPGDYEGRSIRAIHVESRIAVTLSDIQKRCGLSIGSPLHASDIRSCLREWQSVELFRDVFIETRLQNDEGVELSFRLIEKQRIRSIKISGVSALSWRKVREISGLRVGEEYQPKQDTAAEKRLLGWYREHGYFEAAFTVGSVTPAREGPVEILIQGHDGPLARVGRIHFQGGTVWDEATLSRLIKSRPGRPYEHDRLNEDLNTLRDYYIRKGYLQVAMAPPQEQYHQAGATVDITLQIESGPPMEVRILGNRLFKERRLRAELALQGERNFDDLVLESAARRLRELYQKEGYYFATVSYHREVEVSEQVRITFQIDEGSPLSIKLIKIEGNHFFPSRRLYPLLTLQKKGVFLDELADQDAHTLEALYLDAGFVEAKVGMEKEFTPDKSQVTVHFQVVEGPRVFVGKIELKGLHLFAPEEILPLLYSKVGQPYQEGRTREDRYVIQSLYAGRGYLYATVGLDQTTSYDRRYRILTYTLTEERPVTIGTVYLRGNDFTRSAVILRELTLKTGDPFDYEKILLAQRRIRRLGLFTEARLEALHPELKESVKDLTLQIEEGRPGSLEFGLGYGDVERIRGSFEMAYRNLFGTGRQTSFRAEGSSIEQKYTLGYKEPWFLGQEMDARINIVDLIEDKTSFRRRTFGSTAGLEKSFGEKIRTSILYQYEDVSLSDVKPEAILTAEDTGKTRVATINPALVMDFRDDPFNPTSGALYNISFREAAKMLGAKPQFVKLFVQANWFYAPLSRMVLAGSLRGGMAQNFGESKEVPIFERFFVGGRSTVRGYDQERLGVPGETVQYQNGTWTPTGGNAMMVFNGEVRLGLPLGFGTVLFVDTGNVWTKVEDVELTQLRSAAGVGLRYNTPVGPLRLDVGCKLDREEGEDRCVTHFTLGHAF